MRIAGAGTSMVPADLPEHLRRPVVYLDDMDAPLCLRQYEAYQSFVAYYRELHGWLKVHAPAADATGIMQALGTMPVDFFYAGAAR